MPIRIALTGNQNCGKTTLFNALTGANQRVGNWPGVTVEQKSGLLLEKFLRFFRAEARTEEQPHLIDLPGLYAMNPYTMEEEISVRFLLAERPDVIINVVDAANLQRNLYLTSQLAELGIPMVIALNLLDAAQRKGIQVDAGALSRTLKIPAVPIHARSGAGLEALVRAAAAAWKNRIVPAAWPMPPDILKTREAIRPLIRAEKAALPLEYAVSRVMERDEATLRTLDLPNTGAIDALLKRLEQKRGYDAMTIQAMERYRFLETAVQACARITESPASSRSPDRIFLHPVFAFPLFIFIILTVFYLVFGPLGGAVSAGVSQAAEGLIFGIGDILKQSPCDAWVQDLFLQGVCRGVSSVLCFLPTILLLFLFLSLMEDSGYMARAAFLMDRPMRFFGLTGQSFFPLMTGFGCTVPAVMAARGMKDERERRRVIRLIPFFSCGAKVPLYALFAQVFFPEAQMAVMLGLYGLGIFLALLWARARSRNREAENARPFLMELPDYRLPAPGNVLRRLWEKSWDFLRRAFTIILASSVAVWFFRFFTPGLRPAASGAESILGRVGFLLSPAFQPLGFGSCVPVTALLAGLLAKENILSALAVMLGADQAQGGLLSALRSVFPSPGAALSFLVFSLLYAPCSAALAVIRRETQSRRAAALCAGAHTALAWIAAFLVYQAFG